VLVLEFRLVENFLSATRALEKTRIPFQARSAEADFRPNRVWLFQEDASLPGQKEALRRVRLLEREEQQRIPVRALPNLADPS